MDDDFLALTPLRVLLAIPTAIIDRAKALAYECHRGGRHHEAQSLCRGLLAVDHRCGWTHALYAASLRLTNRAAVALEIVELGLSYEPAHPTLLVLRCQLNAEGPTVVRDASPAPPTAAASPTPRTPFGPPAPVLLPEAA